MFFHGFFTDAEFLSDFFLAVAVHLLQHNTRRHCTGKRRTASAQVPELFMGDRVRVGFIVTLEQVGSSSSRGSVNRWSKRRT